MQLRCRLVPILLLAKALCLANGGCWDNTVEFVGRVGDYRQGGEVHFFAPLRQTGRSVLFSDIRFLYLKHQWGGGLGFGYRRAAGAGCDGRPTLAMGLAAFADFAHSDTGVDHFQVVVSGELFGDHWEVHANGYFPDTSRSSIDERMESELFVQLRSPDLGVEVVSDDFRAFDLQQAYLGFDVEGGVYGCYGPGKIRAYFGYFRYTGHKRPLIQGPRLRTEYIFDRYWVFGESEIKLGFEIQSDHVRGIEANFFAGINIPFWVCRWKKPRCRMSLLCQRMGEKVQREIGMIIATEAEREFVRRAVVANLFFVEQGGAGNGSQGDPTNLAAAVAASAPGDVIFLLNDAGPITSLNPTTLQARQQLVSFDDAMTAVIDFGQGRSLTITDNTNQGRGTLDGAGNAVVVALASGNNIQGVGVDAGTIAFSGTGIAGLTMTETLVENLTTGAVKGLELTDVSAEVTLTSNTFRTFAGGATVDGVEITNTDVDATVTLSKNTFEALVSAIGAVDGVAITAIDTSALTISLEENMVTDLTGAAGVAGDINGLAVSKMGTGGSVELTGTSNEVSTLTGGGTIVGMRVETAGADGTTVTTTLTSNSVSDLVNGALTDGILIDATSGGATAVTLTGTLSMNSVSGMKRGLVASMDYGLGTDMLILSMRDNTMDGCTDQGVSVLNRAGGTGQTNLTLTDNTDTDSGIAGYAVTHEAGFTGSTCLLMTGNDSTNSNGIVLTNDGGVFRVVNLADLSADNNNIGVIEMGPGGFTNTTTPCTTP